MLRVVTMQLEAADDKGRKSAQRAVTAASGRLNNFGRELDSLRAMPPPRIEVGSLEEVITRMSGDEAGPWSSAMMLVPPGAGTPCYLRGQAFAAHCTSVQLVSSCVLQR